MYNFKDCNFYEPCRISCITTSISATKFGKYTALIILVTIIAIRINDAEILVFVFR